MSAFERNPLFLKRKFGDLHMAPEVRGALRFKAVRDGEPTPPDPSRRIQIYLDRFQDILDRKDPKERGRGIEAIKRFIHRTAIIKTADIPESIFLLEQRIARNLGYGTVEITDEFRKAKTKEILGNQEQTLNKWIDYLASSDAQYPDWVKYWIFRSMLGMGKFEKQMMEDGGEEAIFKRRTKDTAAPFPPLNQAALAKAVDALLAKLKQDAKPKNERQPFHNTSKKLNQSAFERLIATEDFSKIYTRFLIEMPEYSREGLEETRGKWVKYPRKSPAEPLVRSLEGYPLEWCTVGLETARAQLQGGDFYVYYSIDSAGEARIPRVAIRMQANSIAEVRGIAPGQNIDPYIGKVVEQKMKDFPDGGSYARKARDMQCLTDIEAKIKAGRNLTKQEFFLLEQRDYPVKGFDQSQEYDSRLHEIELPGSYVDQLKAVFRVTDEEIAYRAENISPRTRVVVGTLFVTKEEDIPSSLLFADHILFGDKCVLSGRAAKRCIEICGLKCVTSNLSHFQDLHEEIGYELVERGEGEIVCRSIASFPQLNHQKLVDSLLMSGQSLTVISYFDSFEGIDEHDVLEKLIRVYDKSYSIAKSLHRFKRVRHPEHLLAKLVGQYPEEVLDALSEFPGLHEEEFVFYVRLYHRTGLMEGDVSAVDMIACILLNMSLKNERHHLNAALGNIRIFSPQVREAVLRKAIVVGEIDDVVKCLHQLRGLSSELAMLLVKAERFAAVIGIAENLESFGSLDQEILFALIEKVPVPFPRKPNPDKDVTSRSFVEVLSFFPNVDRRKMVDKVLNRLDQMGIVEKWRPQVITSEQKTLLEYFLRELDYERTIDYVISYRGGLYLKSFISQRWMLRQNIADRLARSGRWDVIVENIRHFKELNESIAEELIKMGNVSTVAWNLNCFQKLSGVVVNELARHGYAKYASRIRVYRDFPDYNK